MQMFMLVSALTIGYVAFVVNATRNNATPAHLTVAFVPDPVAAWPCDAAACPPAAPPIQWTIQGSLRLQETAGLGGTVDAIEVTSYKSGRFVRGSIQGPNVL
jgi:hypothetical protein